MEADTNSSSQHSMSPPRTAGAATSSVAPPPSRNITQGYATQHPSPDGPYYYDTPHPPQFGAQNPNYYNRSEDGMVDPNNNNDSVIRTTAVLALGGVLGVAAAAVVRWLNGGDFVLLPPPTSTAEQSDATRGDAMMNSPPPRSHIPQEITTTTEKEQLSMQMDRIIEVMHSQSQQQERILTKLNQHEAEKTNESMRLLRHRDPDSLSTKLAEVKAELSSLRRDIIQTQVENLRQSWEDRMSETMSFLDECLQQVQATAATNTASAAATETIRGASAMSDNDSVASSASPHHDHSRSATPDIPEVLPSTTMASGVAAAAMLVTTALHKLVTSNERTALLQGAQLLYLYIVNLSNQPRVPRYRKIFTTNESFRKVDSLEGGRDMLLALGFTESEKYLEWLAPSLEDESAQRDREVMYLELLSEAASALGVLKSPGSLSEKELLDKALSKITLDDQRSNEVEITAPTPPPQSLDFKQVPQMFLSSPESGSIISPLVTKKQTIPPNHGFPLSHPSANLDESHSTAPSTDENGSPLSDSQPMTLIESAPTVDNSDLIWK